MVHRLVLGPFIQSKCFCKSAPEPVPQFGGSGLCLRRHRIGVPMVLAGFEELRDVTNQDDSYLLRIERDRGLIVAHEQPGTNRWPSC